MDGGEKTSNGQPSELEPTHKVICPFNILVQV
jgi:hypothetical protein